MPETTPVGPVQRAPARARTLASAAEAMAARQKADQDQKAETAAEEKAATLRWRAALPEARMLAAAREPAVLATVPTSSVSPAT